MKFQKGTLFLLPLLLSPAMMAGCGADSEPENGDGDGTGGVLGGGGTGTGGAASGGAASGGAASGGAASGGSASGGAGTGGLGSGGAGTGGDVGSGGNDAGTGGSAPTGSEGCGMDPGQGFASWEAGNTDGRQYDTWLPDDYDSSRPYPVILLLHGCGSFTNNVPMEQHTGSDAIVVRARGSDGTCWGVDADLPHTDAVIEDVQNRFCVDAENLFVVGWSSGAWLASRMSCDRADTYRGVATVAGGWPGGNSDCNGQLGRIFIHDENDNDNQLAWDTPGRDIMIDNNNCESSTTPVDPSPCVSYNNCDPGYPVVWCQTSGAGHSAQSDLSGPAFWNFFQSLME